MTLLEGDPRTIGGYRLRGRLGAGGMGVVYRAQSVSGRHVAVKVIRPDLADDPQFRDRFRREVAAARRVSGAFTAPVVDADPEAPSPWLATLFIPGPSLAERVQRQGNLTPPEVRRLAAGLVEALRDIHGAGLVHRDLKPGNVLLADDGPRVIDFGIARASAATALTSTGMVVGTPPFMAPEQFQRGEVGPASDVFALGSVLVYAATGHGPFDGDSMHAIGFRVVYEEPDLTGLPDSLRPLVLSCLAKDQAGRATVPELLALLGEAEEDAGYEEDAGAGWGPGTPAPQDPRTPAPTPTTPVPTPTPSPTPTPTAVDGGSASGSRTSAAPTAPAMPSAPPAPPAADVGPGRPRRTSRQFAVAAAAVVALGVAAAFTVPALMGSDDDKLGGRGGGSSTGGAPDVVSCPEGGGAASLKSAGAPAQAAAMQRWTSGFTAACPSTSVAYTPMGSGAGLAAFRSGQTDLAVVDAPLSGDEAGRTAARCGGQTAAQLPLDVVSLAVVYNVAGVKGLALDAEALAGIFDGRITRWNDDRIRRSNPTMVLPDQPITAVVPAQQSSSTLLLTEYLSAAVPSAWTHAPALTMPKGKGTTAASTTDLVARVGQTQGAVSFVPLGAQGSLDRASLATGAKAAVEPTTQAAAKGVASGRLDGTDTTMSVEVDYTTKAEGAYPIVRVDYALVCAKGNNKDVLPSLRSFLDYAVGATGQQAITPDGYAPLPKDLAQKVKAAVKGLS
ncbi:serine/threonine-protein kinase [Streptomyces sp. NPDC001941]|uniref:serine/threonine-protein kinase n=1 Tax=Streptomyces sp. NPDC001941 TaxID=3154659 RepID=UPI00331F35FE